MIDAEKRRLLLGIGTVTVGAALIPDTRADNSPPFHQRQTGRRRGMAGKRWAMFIDLRKCVGCQACTVACCMENQPPIGQFRTTVKQYEVSHSDDKPPIGSPVKMFMLPRLCNHCDEPPCVKVCPVQATWQREDGIVMVDNSRCVACAYCVQACPYDARFINEDMMTADKCTFCAHRLEVGLLPACVESCVGGARLIGDINDPHSKISQLLATHRDQLHVLKPEQQTRPHVFYLGLEDEFISRVNGQPAIYDDLSREPPASEHPVPEHTAPELSVPKQSMTQKPMTQQSIIQKPLTRRSIKNPATAWQPRTEATS